MSTILKYVGLLLLFVIFYKVILVGLFKELGIYFRLKRKGIDVRGKIAEIEKSADIDGIVEYRPIIQYSTLEQTIYFHTSEDSTLQKPIIGDEIKLKYDPENPEIVYISKLSTIVFLWIKILFFFSVFAALLTILIIGS